MKTIYLCGPINGCTDEECKDWREEAKKQLDHHTLDPMDRDYRGVEHLYWRDIVEKDKEDIDNSDIIIVNYDKPSVGTSMEILYAWEQEKPIYVVTTDTLGKLSPWLRYHATYFFNSFEEVFNFINREYKE